MEVGLSITIVGDLKSVNDTDGNIFKVVHVDIFISNIRVDNLIDVAFWRAITNAVYRFRHGPPIMRCFKGHDVI